MNDSIQPPIDEPVDPDAPERVVAQAEYLDHLREERIRLLHQKKDINDRLWTINEILKREDRP